MDNKRIQYITLINVFAAIAVVMLHANSFWTYSADAYWGFTNIIESVFFCAVPLFFMLSGVTLIDYRERYSTKEFFKKRFFKTVIPFLAWSVFAMFWKSRETIGAMITGKPNNGLDWTVGSVTDGILNTKFYDIYWFFIPLFCIYLTIPFFAAVEKKRRIKIYTYAIAVGLVLNVAVPLALSMLKEYADFTMYSKFTLFVSHQYLIYPLIGYVLHNTELKLKSRLIIYGAALAGLLVFTIGTYVRTRASGQLDGLYRGYYGLPCILYSSGMFLFLKNAAQRIKSEKVMRAFRFLQRYTFPIYLIHHYFLDILEKQLPNIGIIKASFGYFIIATVVSTALSVLVTMLLRKIPVLRRIVP